MSNFISQESIDEVTNRADIVGIIGEYIPLTRKGADFWGNCPFHTDKTPSFSVSPEKKFYYCFSCHSGGTVFNFIQEMEKVSFPESVEIVAKKTGITLRYESKGHEALKEDPLVKQKAEYINLYNRVATSFHYLLLESQEGKFAYDYITKRGLTRETLEKFKLGYSPQNRKWLREFLKKKNYTDDFLNKSGLFSSKYPEISFFNDRLMFPIFDKNGDVVAFGGRFLRGDSSKSPKYLNSGDLIQYKKGSLLYAFNFAKKSIRENKKVIICEGYMDCIAYHQCKITWAVAPLGTALTDEQISLLKPYVETIYLSLDSDEAGQKATIRAIKMIRKQILNVRIIQLKGGKDPAEIMLNFGSEYLTNEVNAAILDNDFLLTRLLSLYPKEIPENKAKACLEFFEYIDSIQSDVQKDACLDQLCQAYGIEKEAVRKDFYNRNQISKRNFNVTNEQKDSATKEKVKNTAELRAVLTAVTDNSKLFQEMRNEISVDDLVEQPSKKLFAIMDECFTADIFSVSNILNRIDDDDLKALVFKSMNEYSDCTTKSVQDSIKLLKLNSLERKRLNLQAQISFLSKSSLKEDIENLSKYIIQKMEIDSKISEIKDK